MSISAGLRLGPYEVIAALGAGGMGEVYRARDTQLARDVAIKALPDSVGSDPERVARFQREAQVLASLNHPNIAGIYGVQEAQGAKFLVLEFVEGRTLAEHLSGTRHSALGTGAVRKPGPSTQNLVPDHALPLSEAMDIARQVIDALEAAHDKGIVHRDLKPANIMLTADGQVKVLDFGLARVVESDSTASTSNSPTLTFAATQVGVILGTAAYMSPEQAKGRVADKRSDVWSFGCVLYEMLTGKRVFEGDDVSDTMAAVLRADPDWAALPAAVPEGIRSVLKRCLERDRKTRIPDMAVVRFLLQDALAPSSTALPTPTAAAAATRTRRPWLFVIAALVTGAAIAAAIMWAVRPRPSNASPQVARFGIVAPSEQRLGPTISDRQLAVSPDGKYLVYVSGGSTGGGPLVLRSIDRLDATTLSGVVGARSPFFSPDSKWVGFFQAQEMKKASVSGGPPILLCQVAAIPRGATWGPDGTIIFATADPATGLQSVLDGGGLVKNLTTPNSAQGEGDHVLPSMLPDGRGVLFTISPPNATQAATYQIAVLDLTTGSYKTLIRGARHAEYVDPGYLVYSTGSSLSAVRFDLARREVLSDPVEIVEGVGEVLSGTSEFVVSRTGTLIYVPASVLNLVGGGNPRSLVWINRQGREEPIKAPPRAYFNLRLSPDGTRVALDIRDQQSDVWVWDLARLTLTPLTFDPGADLFPIWTRDNRRIMFASARSGSVNIYAQAADGTGTVERLTTAPYPQYPMSFSLDGKQLLINELKPGQNADVSALTLGGQAEPVPLIATPAIERTADVSPDGRWVVFESDESTKSEIYVRPFPDINGGRWQISTAGGTKPSWSRDGREIFYIDANSFLTTVPVQTVPTFKAGNPTKLFEARNISTLGSARFYDASPDGKRFIVIKDLPPPPGAQMAGTTSPTFVVVVNWAEELKTRVATK